MRVQELARSETHALASSDHDYPTQLLVDRRLVLVEVRDAPPLAIMALRVEGTDEEPSASSALRVTSATLANAFVHVRIGADGTVTITDLATGEVFPGLHVFEDRGDVGDEYSFSAPTSEPPFHSEDLPHWTHRRIVARGPLRAALELKGSMSIPAAAHHTRTRRSNDRISMEITTCIALDEDSPIVRFTTTINNTANDHRLRVLFPAGFPADAVWVDQHFYPVDRNHSIAHEGQYDIEVPSPVHPMQRFVAAHSDHRSIAILSRGAMEYAWDHRRGVFALTLLRSVGDLSRGDLASRPGGEAGWKHATPGAQCHGTFTFEYAVLVGGSLDRASLLTHAETYECPMMARATTRTMEQGPAGLVAIMEGPVVFSTIADAMRGNGVIVRITNPTPFPVEANLRVNDIVKRVARVRLDESHPRRLRTTGNTVALRFGAHEIVTLRLEP
jgi:mannosylglycerate hydrolase